MLKAGNTYEIIAVAESSHIADDNYFNYNWRTAADVAIARRAQVLSVSLLAL